jgi:hypothetical protein
MFSVLSVEFELNSALATQHERSFLYYGMEEVSEAVGGSVRFSKAK